MVIVRFFPLFETISFLSFLHVHFFAREPGHRGETTDFLSCIFCFLCVNYVVDDSLLGAFFCLAPRHRLCLSCWSVWTLWEEHNRVRERHRTPHEDTDDRVCWNKKKKSKEKKRRKNIRFVFPFLRFYSIQFVSPSPFSSFVISNYSPREKVSGIFSFFL